MLAFGPVRVRAVTLYVPARQFGTQVTVALPSRSVIANEGRGAHVGPDGGATKSTRTLSAGRPSASTITARNTGPLLVKRTVAFDGGKTAP